MPAVAGGGDGNFAVAQANQALVAIKAHIGGAVGIERQQSAVAERLPQGHAFCRAVIGAQSFRQFAAPHLPAAAGGNQQHQPFQHLATRQATVVERPAGKGTGKLSHLLAQVFDLLPRPLVIAALFIPLLPADLLSGVDATIA